MEATTFIISHTPKPEHLDTEILLARGEINLHKSKKDGVIERGISIDKLRGSDFDDYIRPMKITNYGIEVKNSGTFRG
jgi:KaiC/GvpD/RAD55 family RecA-like ATPase